MSGPPTPPGGPQPRRVPPDDDRRNHYRVLHVQPEAPLPVIKASYRALMGNLRMHPDLGGDPAQALAINTAWAVLSDPQRRAAYDRLLHRLGHLAPREAAAPQASAAAWPNDGLRPKTPAQAQTPGPFGDPSHHRAQEPRQEPPPEPPQQWAHEPPHEPPHEPAPASAPTQGQTLVEPRPARRQCALCAQPCAATVQADARCPRCQAPLAAWPAPDGQARELLGRRGALRRGKDQVALLHVGWPAPALPVRWRDLSLSGLSFYAPQPVAAGQRVHLVDPALEAVAEVVASRRQGRLFTVHARLITLLLQRPTGVFMSASA